VLGHSQRVRLQTTLPKAKAPAKVTKKAKKAPLAASSVSQAIDSSPEKPRAAALTVRKATPGKKTIEQVKMILIFHWK
jgi:hypothetical protein